MRQRIIKNLKIYTLSHEDAWKDMARIPGGQRYIDGDKIHRNTVWRVIIGRKKKLLMIRGHRPEQDARILLDLSTQDDFGIQEGKTYEVEFRPIRLQWLGYAMWGWNASDPAYRLPFQISTVSLILGLIGLALGIISLRR